LRGDCLATPLGSIHYRQKATPKNLTPDFYRRLPDPCNQAYITHFLKSGASIMHSLQREQQLSLLRPALRDFVRSRSLMTLGDSHLYGTLKWNTNPYYNLYRRLLREPFHPYKQDLFRSLIPQCTRSHRSLYSIFCHGKVAPKWTTEFVSVFIY
jgi:hypothetical protein